MKVNIKYKLKTTFLKVFVRPFVSLCILLAIIFISFRAYMFDNISKLELIKATKILQTSIDSEKKSIEDKFLDTEFIAKLIQQEHENIFKYKNISNLSATLKKAKNNSFYKIEKEGSSVYYSSITNIGEKERNKVLFTQNMDQNFKTIIDNNPLIKAVYFNSYDNMNRIYPYIDKVYEQFGSGIVMQGYNFYYLADAKHNPKREPVWTEAYLDPAGNGWMVSCIVPIYNGDFLEGVSGFDITIESIVSDILYKKLPFKAKMMLINKSGTITAMHNDIAKLSSLQELTKHHYTEIISSTIKKPKEFNIYQTDKPLFKKISKMVEKDIQMTEIALSSKDYIILQTNIKNTNSTLVLIVEKTDTLATISIIREKSLILIVLLLLIFFITFVMIYKLNRKKFNKLIDEIEKPISYLSLMSSNIQKYKNGELNTLKTDIEEFNKLNANFINILEELDSKNKKLKEFNNFLGQKVKESTKELREKNEVMNNLIDTAMESITIFDSDYNLIQVNQSAVDIFKYKDKKSMIGKNIYDFIPKEEESKAKEALQQNTITPYEINLFRRDKSTFIALVRGQDSIVNGKLHRITTLMDLTNIKEKDKQLLQQAKQAQMGEMISMIAHQWRQPLNAISATSINLSLLSSMDMLNDDKLQEDSGFMQEQCQKMSQIIDTFMNFVKPSQESKEFKISHTLDLIMQIMSTQLINHNIKVTIKSDNEDIALVGYEDLLEQVIINIISNARDAFNKIGNNISSTNTENFITIRVSKENNIPVIRIQDNAGGIPTDVKDKIFNPYFTTKEQGKGTGIGLYMSLDIMKKSFSGDILYSATDDGSIFDLVCGGIDS